MAKLLSSRRRPYTAEWQQQRLWQHGGGSIGEMPTAAAREQHLQQRSSGPCPAAPTDELGQAGPVARNRQELGCHADGQGRPVAQIGCVKVGLQDVVDAWAARPAVEEKRVQRLMVRLGVQAGAGKGMGVQLERRHLMHKCSRAWRLPPSHCSASTHPPGLVRKGPPSAVSCHTAHHWEGGSDSISGNRHGLQQSCFWSAGPAGTSS